MTYRSDAPPNPFSPIPHYADFPDAEFRTTADFGLLPKTTWGTPSFSVLRDVANMKNASPAARLSRDDGDRAS